jgi:small subunit ribosomal protein S1
MSEIEGTEVPIAESGVPEALHVDTPEVPGASVPSAEAGFAEPIPAEESFSDILSQFEKAHTQNAEDGNRQIEATVIAVSTESAFLDIGFKTEGILPLASLAGKHATVGDKFQVSVKGQGRGW